MAFTEHTLSGLLLKQIGMMNNHVKLFSKYLYSEHLICFVNGWKDQHTAEFRLVANRYKTQICDNIMIIIQILIVNI